MRGVGASVRLALMSRTALSSASLAELSAALLSARATTTPIAPPSDAHPELTVAQAYAIAREGVDAELAAGARVVGHKIGLTSLAVQRQLGVDTPDYGTLLDTMEIPDGAEIDAGDYCLPRLELELAFRLAAPLRGPGIGVEDVRRATGSVHPAIELVDSRIADWRITLVDTVADRASSASFVVGARGLTLEEIAVEGVAVELFLGDELIESGQSDAVLGDPCLAVAWLANALCEHGETLETGQTVLSGACTRMTAIAPGDRFRATFSGLGELTLAVAS